MKDCASEYAEAPERDRRCIQEEGHDTGAGATLHFNAAGFAWDDKEAAESAARVAAGAARRTLVVRLMVGPDYPLATFTFSLEDVANGVYQLVLDRGNELYLANHATAAGVRLEVTLS